MRVYVCVYVHMFFFACECLGLQSVLLSSPQQFQSHANIRLTFSMLAHSMEIVDYYSFLPVETHCEYVGTYLFGACGCPALMSSFVRTLQFKENPQFDLCFLFPAQR